MLRPTTVQFTMSLKLGYNHFPKPRTVSDIRYHETSIFDFLSHTSTRAITYIFKLVAHQTALPKTLISHALSRHSILPSILCVSHSIFRSSSQPADRRSDNLLTKQSGKTEASKTHEKDLSIHGGRSCSASSFASRPHATTPPSSNLFAGQHAHLYHWVRRAAYCRLPKSFQLQGPFSQQEDLSRLSCRLDGERD